MLLWKYPDIKSSFEADNHSDLWRAQEICLLFLAKQPSLSDTLYFLMSELLLLRINLVIPADCCLRLMK